MANLFDIIGPIMIGPSSSHTAGAVRMGNLARNIIKEDVLEAHIYLHGSFALTWKGHGTDKALIAGLLGYPTDDVRIRDAYNEMNKAGLKVEFIETELKDAFHTNSTLIEAKGKTNNTKILTSSIGGGVIILDKIEGIEVHYKGEYPTIVIVNRDVPGVVAKVTSLISDYGVNIETMSITPDKESKKATIVIGLETLISKELEDKIKKVENIEKYIFLEKLY